MITECIKEGFALANRNLQLAVIRIIVSVINITALAVFLGVPLIVAVAYFGFDVAHARHILPSIADNPMEFVSRYLGLAFLLVIAVFAYLFFASLLFLYTLGGTLGSLRNSFSNASVRFALPAFFREANAHFSRLFWLLSLVFLGITVLLAACAVIAGIAVLIMNSVSAHGEAVTLFLRAFTAVFVIISCGIALIGSIIVSAYSAVISVVEEKGAMESVKITINFFRNRPQALLYFVILMVSILAASLILFSIQIPLRFIPFMNLAMYLINAFISGYLSIVLWSSLISYYMRASGSPVYHDGYEI